MLTLERLETHQRTQAGKLADEWKAYALRIATTPDEEHDPAEVLAELNRLGKSLDDLRAVTELASKRRELAELAAGLPEAEKAASKATEAAIKEIERFRKAEEEHRRKRVELSNASSLADQTKRDCENARRELLAGCRADLREQLETLQRQVSPLVTTANHCREVIANGERQTVVLSPEAASAMVNAREELRELEPQIETLRKRIADVERQAMEPNAIEI